MRRPTITAALLLTALCYPAFAQSTADHEAHHPPQDQVPASTLATSPAGQPGRMGEMMGRGMKGRAMMGCDTMGPPIMFRMMFALMDADGDGTISLPEFQVAHERIFKAMDSNKDGKLTMEEMLGFMHGTRSSVPQQ